MHTADEINEINEKIRTENANNSDIEDREQTFDRAKNALYENLKNNGRDLFGRNFVESVKGMAVELGRDFKEIQDQRARVDDVEKSIDKATSEAVIKAVSEEYKKNFLIAEGIIHTSLKEYWISNAQQLRSQLITIIVGTDALTSAQRDELQAIIINYQPLEFNDNADSIFIKTKFLRGNFFGIKLSDDEKLDIRRLTDTYNVKIKENIKEMSQNINADCSESFRNWEEKLGAIIEQNITEYNPDLRCMADFIQEETEKIVELEEDQRTIGQSLEAIKDLMSWKTLA